MLILILILILFLNFILISFSVFRRLIRKEYTIDNFGNDYLYFFLICIFFYFIFNLIFIFIFIFMSEASSIRENWD